MDDEIYYFDDEHGFIDGIEDAFSIHVVDTDTTKKHTPKSNIKKIHKKKKSNSLLTKEEMDELQGILGAMIFVALIFIPLIIYAHYYVRG
jgi:hypothetical protein